MEVISLKRLLINNTGLQVVAHAISLGIGLATTMILIRHIKGE